ncbi:MAG: hypothetical protein F6K26_55375 [Moorea sp. SIO2I5]|nr:hypothetical protein [Moorena sp. SIO2I5]
MGFIIGNYKNQLPIFDDNKRQKAEIAIAFLVEKQGNREKLRVSKDGMNAIDLRPRYANAFLA